MQAFTPFALHDKCIITLCHPLESNTKLTNAHPTIPTETLTAHHEENGYFLIQCFWNKNTDVMLMFVSQTLISIVLSQ